MGPGGSDIRSGVPGSSKLHGTAGGLEQPVIVCCRRRVRSPRRVSDPVEGPFTSSSRRVGGASSVTVAAEAWPRPGDGPLATVGAGLCRHPTFVRPERARHPLDGPRPVLNQQLWRVSRRLVVLRAAWFPTHDDRPVPTFARAAGRSETLHVPSRTLPGGRAKTSHRNRRLPPGPGRFGSIGADPRSILPSAARARQDVLARSMRAGRSPFISASGPLWRCMRRRAARVRRLFRDARRHNLLIFIDTRCRGPQPAQFVILRIGSDASSVLVEMDGFSRTTHLVCRHQRDSSIPRAASSRFDRQVVVGTPTQRDGTDPSSCPQGAVEP